MSIAKKSLNKNQFSEIKKGQEIARYKDDSFFLTKEGFYKINTDGKLSKIIERDPEWGTIVDIWIYNGNIYALDSSKDQIYKYLVAENGYSAKTAYFKGGAAGLKDANSLAIDSSVYVGFTDHVFKFTAGEQEEFKTSFPESNVRLSKVFTTKELEKVYAWNKNAGLLYVLGKNGSYERQLFSSLLKQIDDFVVYQNKAYLLLGPKIYMMSLD